MTLVFEYKNTFFQCLFPFLTKTAAAFEITQDPAFYFSTLDLLNYKCDKRVNKERRFTDWGHQHNLKFGNLLQLFCKLIAQKMPLWSTINLTYWYGTTQITPPISLMKPYTNLKNGYCYFCHKRNILIKIIQRVTYLKIREYKVSRSNDFCCVAHEMK